MRNTIKTEFHLISSDDIIAITKLTDRLKRTYGIEIHFKYASSIRICNSKEAEEILSIYEEKTSD